MEEKSERREANQQREEKELDWIGSEIRKNARRGQCKT